LTKALQDLGVTDHLFPFDFFRRHWRDQQNYIEQILELKFCPRCKLPAPYLDGMLCVPCAENNMRTWQSTMAYRERAAHRSLTDRPVIDTDIMERFQEGKDDVKAQRMAREYGISEEDARTILNDQKPKPEPKTSVADILTKARKPA